MKDTTRISAGLLLTVLPGCYTGVEHPLGQTGASDTVAGDSGIEDDDAAETGDANPGDDADPGDTACAQRTVGRQPMRRLTRVQYDRAISDLLGLDVHAASVFPADEKAGPFRSNVATPVSELQVEQYMDAAEDLARVATENVDTLVSCDDAAQSDACASSFIARFGRRALRRPLEASELAVYEDLYRDGAEAEGFETGIRLVVQAMLQSPQFLYHVELGTAGPNGETLVALTDYELASRLSFFLWNSIPDDALLDLADARGLSSAEQVREQAERMLEDPKAREAIGSFHVQWLGLDELDHLEKDPELYPELDDAVVDAMQRETIDFANWVVFEDDARLQTLLTSSSSILSEPLFPLYGLDTPPGYRPGDPVQLDPEQRAGVLTQVGFLAEHAHVDQSSPVHRGVLVRENLLCQILPPPPENANDVPPDPDPNATTRERFAEHTADPACAGCHVLIDGIGFGFEHYDAVGVYRTHEGELPVDASGELVNTSDANGTFVGAVELAHALAQSNDVRRCVSRQWMSFALGRVPTTDDDCAAQTVLDTFIESDDDLYELLLAVVTSDSFRFIHRPEA